ncbi:prepilin peptidase [Halobellus sp. GM3]|uniref:prepilin peptidase n=1 Tax=Halobellus sp. GM3 TaxID=3458410 RepID=UPI00403D89B0
MLGSVPDLLRLVVLPVLAWTAWRDVETRRVPSRTWAPLVGLGLLLLVVDAVGQLSASMPAAALFFVRVAVSLFLVAPIAYLFWRLGGFGGADAKALITIAILLPTFPTYYFSGYTLPYVETTLGVFSMTILTNTVVLAAAYPLALAVRNALDGDVAFPVAFLGRRIATDALPTAHGRLFETPEGFSRNGLDIDALRMYLRWRGATLEELRADPDRFRDPASIDETHDPTDGAVVADGGEIRERRGDGADDPATVDPEDPWGAAAFLDDIEGTAYGTTPETLRGGLEIVSDREEVWISPGIPFLVPMFLGTLLAFTYGDLVFGALGLFGVV